MTDTVEKPWRVFTPEEYALAEITGRHVIERDHDGFGGVAVWLLGDNAVVFGPKHNWSVVILERFAGCDFVWIVWALKPGEAHVAAICTTEAKADRYVDNPPPFGAGVKMWKEKVPLNHAFGYRDSVAMLMMKAQER